MGADGTSGVGLPRPKLLDGELRAEEVLDVIGEVGLVLVEVLLGLGGVRLMSALVTSWSMAPPTSSRSLRKVLWLLWDGSHRAESSPQSRSLTARLM